LLLNLLFLLEEKPICQWKQTTETFSSSCSRKWWGKFNEEPWRQEPWELRCCMDALWDLVDGEEASRVIYECKAIML